MPTSDGITLLSMWDLGGIHVEQRVYFATNPDTGRSDTTAIEYRLTNTNPTPRQVGLRLLLDVMIGENDGGPFFVPDRSDGRITKEMDFSQGVPNYWLAWESPTFDPSSLKAKGFLRGNGLSRPNRLIIAHWNDDLCPGTGPGLFANAWDYTVNPALSITCDSAIALYYDPIQLNPGTPKTFKTYYGLTGGGVLDLAPDITSFVANSRQLISNISRDAIDVSGIGDFYLDRQDTKEAERIITLGLGFEDALSINWSLVGRGLNHIATPGYKAALHASWRGWSDVGGTKRWSKELYDVLHDNRQLAFTKVVRDGLEYYAKEAGKEIAKDEIQTWLIERFVPSPTNPVHDLMGVPASQKADSYLKDLQSEQDDLMARLPSLPFSTQISAYRNDMQARRLANAQIAAQSRAHRDFLWQNYQATLADENNWLKYWSPTVLSWGVIGVAAAAADGPGLYVASVGTGAVNTVYELIQDTRDMEAAGNMYDQSKQFLEGQVHISYEQIALNTLSGLYLIREGLSPQIATGTVTINSMQSIGHEHYWPICSWSEESSLLRLSIGNASPYTTTYLISAAYNHSDSWKGTSRLSIGGDALELSGLSQSVATIKFKSPSFGGVSPDEGSVIDLLVIGATETGLYPIASLPVIWNPTKSETQSSCSVLQNSKAADSATTLAVPTYPHPLLSSVTVLPGTVDHQVSINVFNPFTLTVSAVVTQPVPANFNIQNLGGGLLISNSLVFSASLQPGTGIRFKTVLGLPGSLGLIATLPAPILSFKDPNTNQGDIYVGQDAIVAVAWPLASSTRMSTTWQIGSATNMSITLTNLTSSVSWQGGITVTAQTPDGITLWSETHPVSVAASGNQIHTLSFSVPRKMGYAIVSADVNLGAQQKRILYELVEIKGYRNYLPLIEYDEE